jgi:Flp pilus assembly protein TadG
VRRLPLVRQVPVAGLKVSSAAADHNPVSVARQHVAHLHRDQRGIVGVYMAKLVIVLALIGIVFVEGGAVVFSKLQAQDLAESAAVAGAASWWHNKNAEQAREQALINLEDKTERAKMTSFEVHPDGRVTVTIKLKANTVLLDRISFFEPYTVTTSTATAQPPNPDV